MPPTDRESPGFSQREEVNADPPTPRDVAKAEHLHHMTDGRWHDDCRYCLQRRVTGGTGIPAVADRWDFDARLKAAADRATPKE